MSSRALARRRAVISDPSSRGARSVADALPGSDVLLVFAAAFLACSVFELAAWLAAAPLSTLVYFLTTVPLALFLTAVISGHRG